jgi:hypothetical protein
VGAQDRCRLPLRARSARVHVRPGVVRHPRIAGGAPEADAPGDWRLAPARLEPLAALALGFVGLPACADQADSRGTLVSADPIADLDLGIEQIGPYLTTFGLDPAAAQYAVKTFEYVYRTVDVSGAPTIASGLFALPITGDDRELPLVTWLHGTRVYRGEVASNLF